MIQISKGELNGFLKLLLGIGVLLLIALGIYFLWLLRSFLLLCIVALILVFLLRPMVDFLSRGSFKIARRKKVQLKLPRILSITIVFMVLITVLFWIIFPAVQILVAQVSDLTETFQQTDLVEVKDTVAGWVVSITQGNDTKYISDSLGESYSTAVKSIQKRIRYMSNAEEPDEELIADLEETIEELRYKILITSPSSSVSETIDKALESLTTWLSSLASTLISGTVNLVGKVANWIFNGFIVLILTIFLLVDWDLVNAALFSLFPNETSKTMRGLFANVYQKIWTYVRAQSLLSATTGLLVGSLCVILGLPSAFIIGIIVALGEMVPYIGPIISFSIGLLLAIASAIPTASWSIVFWYCIGFILIEQSIDLIISKPLFAKVTQTHPLLIIVAMFAFTILFGPFAILLAIPFLVLVKAIYEYLGKETNIFSRFGISLEYSSKVPSISNSNLLKNLRKPFSRLNKK
jgi:predicted PurR-regulated permease PerM